MDYVVTPTANAREEIWMSANFHLPLAAADREVAGELQGMLVELIDLALIGKQAHWNVVGPHFRSVHAEMDQLVDAWRALGDDVAERAVALGAAPDGQVEAVAGASELIVMAVPAQHVRSVALAMRGALGRGAPVVSCAKGLERQSSALMPEVLVEALPQALSERHRGRVEQLEQRVGVGGALRDDGERLAVFRCHQLQRHQVAVVAGVPVVG